MAQNNIPPCEVFWSLINKADRKYSRVRDLPHYGRSRYDLYFQKVFNVYTRLWKFQQEQRQSLVEAGVRRWEIGEIAARIAQLNYEQYLRTSDVHFLSEAYTCYEAVLTREYYKDGPSLDYNLAAKQLRFLVRFLMVCLMLSKRDMVNHIVNVMKKLLDECKRSFQENEFKIWKRVVKDIVKFLNIDSAFMNLRPLRYSLVFDSHLNDVMNAESFVAKRCLRLREAILCSCRPNEVMLTEITVDTFRMFQCLEWEPSGTFYLRNKASRGNASDSGQIGAGYCLPDIMDPTLPPNPRKTILDHPSATHFIAVLAIICEELPPDGIVLVYLSASGKSAQTSQLPLGSGIPTNSTESIVGNLESLEVSSDVHSQPDVSTKVNDQNKEIHEIKRSGCLRMSPPGNGGPNNLYPLDLIPFTRRPLFLIVDSDNSQSFKAIHGTEMAEPAAMLLSPSLPSPSRLPGGSQFTMFLTAPLQSFCLLLGFSESEMEKNQDVYNKAEELLSSLLNQWCLLLVRSDTLNPVWAQVLCDPFLRRFLLRFIFFRTSVALHAPTFNKKEFYPECFPSLPDSVLPTEVVSQTAILRLASLFEAEQAFIFSNGISLPADDDEE
ncbi:hypothetical protein Scep_008929 [Stephania cephalantha]|uniref:Protein SCAI n=1 Tax=Stephania cephalantha TaxID=152367 RepID=A0AAP0JTM0_9MAGN